MKGVSIDVHVVHLDYVLWISITDEEPEVDTTANDLVCEVMVFNVLNLHAVGVSEQDNVEEWRLRGFSSQVDRMVTVELLIRHAVVHSRCVC